MKKMVAIIFAMMLMFSSIATSYAVDSPVADIYTDVDSDGGNAPDAPLTGDLLAGLILASVAALSVGGILVVKKNSK